MKERKPETKLLATEKCIEWCVYQDTNRGTKNFKGTHNLISYETIKKIKENETYETYLEREARGHTAIFTNQTKVEMHEAGYKISFVAPIVGILSLLGVVYAFLNATKLSSGSSTTLSPLNSSQINDIKSKAFTYFNSFYNKTDTFSRYQVEQLLHKFLNESIDFTYSTLNDELSLSAQSSSDLTTTQKIAVATFAGGVIVGIINFISSIVSIERKSSGLQKKQLFEMQKKLIERIPKIKKEIDFKEGVIKKIFLLLGLKEQSGFAINIINKYFKFIKFLDHKDNLNIYSDLEAKLNLLLDKNIFEDCKKIIFKEFITRIHEYFKEKNLLSKKDRDFKKFKEKYTTFEKIYVKAEDIVKSTNEQTEDALFLYMYSTLETLVDELLLKFKLSVPDTNSGKLAMILEKIGLFSDKIDTLITKNGCLEKEIQNLKQNKWGISKEESDPQTVTMVSNTNIIKNQALEARQNTLRDRLHDEEIVKQKLFQHIPSYYQLGAAIGRGDCFFDAMAQSLNALKGSKEYTAKSLRLLCDEYIKNPMNADWVKEAIIKNGSDYQGYLVRIQFTADEVEMLKQQGNLDLEQAEWGNPHIEGRIICEVLQARHNLVVKLHLIEVCEQANHGVEIFEQQVDAVSAKSIDPLTTKDYEVTNVVHLVNYKNHFVPLLDGKKAQTEEPLTQLIERSPKVRLNLNK